MIYAVMRRLELHERRTLPEMYSKRRTTPEKWTRTLPEMYSKRRTTPEKWTRTLPVRFRAVHFQRAYFSYQRNIGV